MREVTSKLAPPRDVLRAKMKVSVRLVWLFAFPILAQAHEDPIGEIHPYVFVNGQEFHILFWDNTNTKPLDLLPSPTYRKIYSSSGDLKKKREEIPKDEALSYMKGSSPRFLLNDSDAKIQIDDGVKFAIQRWHFMHPGKPSLEKLDGEQWSEVLLSWGDHFIEEVSDFLISDSNLFIVATSALDKKRTLESEKLVLWLFHFELENGSLIHESKIGKPSFIYTFPAVSNLDLNGDIISVVWNTVDKVSFENTLHLGRYNTQGRNFSAREFPFESTWNTRISIASIGDTLCIAYHGIEEEISVHFENLNSEPGGSINSEQLRRSPL